MSATELSTRSLQADLVPGPVEYAVLRPPGYLESAERYPLLLLLHGGGGSCEFLAQMRPVIERAWDQGLLPHAVVATPSAGRSFYLDYFDGRERWETFLLDELIPALERDWRVGSGREDRWVCGVSMGGMGCLRLALKHPERFGAVAALEPGIEPALTFADVPLRDRVYREPSVYAEKFGEPLDEAYWQANNPANVARANARAIVRSGLAIYVECGDEDSFYLHHGAEFLHRVLFDGGIPHEYRLVRGADHVGPSLGPRLLDALAFLGRTRQQPAVDTAGPMPLPTFRKMVEGMRKQRGYVHASTHLVPAADAVIHVTERGAGDAVVLLPSQGRGAADFDDLATRLALAGHRVLTPEPRGLGQSSGPLRGLTLHDLARDVAHVIEALDAAPACIVGHAFGNRVARMLAADRSDLVRRVVLLGAGGKVSTPTELAQAASDAFHPLLPRKQRLANLQRAFFAKASDPVAWLHGFHPELAVTEARADIATPVDEWWGAGNAPILVVQGLEDAVAPPENARLLVEQYGDRVQLQNLPDAGHAMLPEQPDAIARILIDWLS